MTGVKHKTIVEALEWVTTNPEPSTDDATRMPVWELVSRELVNIANFPDPRVRGSLTRATRAQRMLFDRLVGTRRPGTHPAQAAVEQLHMVDLTVAVLPAAPEPQEATDE